MKVKITQPISVVNSANLKVGTEHQTVPCPKEYQRYKNDIWVQGEKEPVRLFPREYEITDKSEPDHIAYTINVEVVDMDVISEQLNKQLQKSKDFKGNDYEIKEKLAILIIGKNIIITDEEACFFDNADKPFSIDFYRKSVKTESKDGSTSTKMFMFPSGVAEFNYDDFKNHIKEKTSLAEFMGNRFQYNSRVIDNLNHLIQHANSQ